MKTTMKRFYPWSLAPLMLLTMACGNKDTSNKVKAKPVTPQELPQNILGVWKGSGEALVLGRMVNCTLTMDIGKKDNKLNFNRVIYDCKDGRRAALDGRSSMEIGSIETNGEYGLFFNGLAVGTLSKDDRKMSATIRQQNADWEIQMELPKKSQKLNVVFQRFRESQSIVFESNNIQLDLQETGSNPGTSTASAPTSVPPIQSQGPQWLNPREATSYKNAKYVVCKTGNYEAFISFPKAELYENSWGQITGEIGPAVLGIRRDSTSKFQSYSVEQPGLISNGPKITLTAYDYNAGVTLRVSTYDFIKGDAALALDTVSTPLQSSCTYYQSEGYKL